MVVALGSGKGGVGKTTLALALADRLCAQGHVVTLVDAHLGGQSLEVVLSENPGQSLPARHLRKPVNVSSHPESGGLLQLVTLCDAASHPDAEEDGNLAARLTNSLRRLRSDLVVIDLGPGSAPFTLDCFLAADLGVIVTTPEPLAVRGAFRFLEACLVHGLRRKAQGRPEAQRLLRFLRKRGGEDATLRQLLAGFNNGRHCLNSLVEELLHQLRVGIVVNCVREEADRRIGQTLRAMALDFLGVHAELWGYVPFQREMRHLGRTIGATAPRTAQLFDGCLDPLTSVMELAKYGLRPDWRIQTLLPPARANARQVMCSAKCRSWPSCQLRHGGYPCRITPLGELKTLANELAE
ncbi:MAG: P-loop NTPase [Candidatus Oleimicrobiaceae bacterium]